MSLWGGRMMKVVFPIRVLILGANGMLGHVLFKKLFHDSRYEVIGTVRNNKKLDHFFSKEERNLIISDTFAESDESIWRVFCISKPDIVINCIGIIKQLPEAQDKTLAINVNSLFPHKLAQICEQINARLIHFSTDCVFSGEKGDYTETDICDARDLYGKTKLLGEVDYLHTVTLRTSIIGHELQSEISLINWFLSQEKKVKGYSRMLFTGLTTYEVANVIMNKVIPNPDLSGLYHLVADKISKYHLLKLVADVYGKSIEIEEYQNYILDRSLLGERFNNTAGYKAPPWSEMIQNMHEYYKKWDCYYGKPNL